MYKLSLQATYMFSEPCLIQNRFRLLILLNWNCFLNLEGSLTLCRRRHAHEVRSVALELTALALCFTVVSAHEGCRVSFHPVLIYRLHIACGWAAAFLDVLELVTNVIAVF